MHRLGMVNIDSVEKVIFYTILILGALEVARIWIKGEKMKKVITFIITLLAVMGITAAAIVALCGFNYSIFDTTYDFDKAMIVLPNGEVVIGEVDSWTDFEDGDQIQVKINGITYLTHATNVVLIDR